MFVFYLSNFYEGFSIRILKIKEIRYMEKIQFWKKFQVETETQAKRRFIVKKK